MLTNLKLAKSIYILTRIYICSLLPFAITLNEHYNISFTREFIAKPEFIVANILVNNHIKALSLLNDNIIHFNRLKESWLR